MGSNNLKGPGAYFSCRAGSPEMFDSANANYFVKHPNLKWVSTTSELAKQVPGVVKLSNGNMIGRVELTENGNTFTQIALAYTNSFFYYADPFKVLVQKRDIEVLVCQP